MYKIGSMYSKTALFQLWNSNVELEKGEFIEVGSVNKVTRYETIESALDNIGKKDVAIIRKGE